MFSVFWKTTFIYGIGFIGLRMISFLLLPLYTNILTPSEAGIIFIIYTVLAFLNTLYSRGMDAALFKFYNQDNSIISTSTSLLYSIKHGGILSVVLWVMVGIFFAVGLIEHHAISWIILIGLISVLFCDMLSARCMSILRLENKPFYYLSACLSSVAATIILNIWFLSYQKMGISGAIWAIIIASLIQIVILLPILFRAIKLSQNNADLLLQMKAFSWPFLPAAIFLILIELSDRWLIGLLSLQGTADVGIYSTGYKFGSLIMLCVKAFNLNWQPYYLKKNTKDSFYKIGSIFLSLLIILSTLISIMWPMLFYWLIGESFWKGGEIIPIITASYIFYGLFILQMPSIYLKNKERWAPWFWGVGLAINLILNCLLIPIYGYYGAALATLLAYASMAIYIVYKNYDWMPMKYNMAYITYITILSCVAMIIWNFLHVMYNFNNPNTFLLPYLLIVALGLIYFIISSILVWLMYKKI